MRDSHVRVLNRLGVFNYRTESVKLNRSEKRSVGFSQGKKCSHRNTILCRLNCFNPLTYIAMSFYFPKSAIKSGFFSTISNNWINLRYWFQVSEIK